MGASQPARMCTAIAQRVRDKSSGSYEVNDVDAESDSDPDRDSQDKPKHSRKRRHGRRQRRRRKGRAEDADLADDPLQNVSISEQVAALENAERVFFRDLQSSSRKPRERSPSPSPPSSPHDELDNLVPEQLHASQLSDVDGPVLESPTDGARNVFRGGRDVELEWGVPPVVDPELALRPALVTRRLPDLRPIAHLFEGVGVTASELSKSRNRLDFWTPYLTYSLEEIMDIADPRGMANALRDHPNRRKILEAKRDKWANGLWHVATVIDYHVGTCPDERVKAQMRRERWEAHRQNKNKKKKKKGKHDNPDEDPIGTWLHMEYVYNPYGGANAARCEKEQREFEDIYGVKTHAFYEIQYDWVQLAPSTLFRFARLHTHTSPPKAKPQEEPQDSRRGKAETNSYERLFGPVDDQQGEDEFRIEKNYKAPRPPATLRPVQPALELEPPSPEPQADDEIEVEIDEPDEPETSPDQPAIKPDVAANVAALYKPTKRKRKHVHKHKHTAPQPQAGPQPEPDSRPGPEERPALVADASDMTEEKFQLLFELSAQLTLVDADHSYDSTPSLFVALSHQLLADPQYAPAIQAKLTSVLRARKSATAGWGGYTDRQYIETASRVFNKQVLLFDYASLAGQDVAPLELGKARSVDGVSPHLRLACHIPSFAESPHAVKPKRNRKTKPKQELQNNVLVRYGPSEQPEPTEPEPLRYSSVVEPEQPPPLGDTFGRFDTIKILGITA